MIMKKKRSSQGSALLLAVIVVLLAAGLGGSFLIVNISNSRTQQNMSDQDELMVMCDAGLERAKQALDMYRFDYNPTSTYVAPVGAQRWDWSELLSYCYAALPPLAAPVNYWDPPDMHAIMEDALKCMNDPSNSQYALFKNYAGSVAWDAKDTTTSLWGKNSVQAEWTVPPIGQHSTPNVGHPYLAVPNKVFIGWNIPFHKGAIHIFIHNNHGKKVDSAGLTRMHTYYTTRLAEDTQFEELDDAICITVTATMRGGPKAAQSHMGGIVRQIEAVYRRPEYQPPTPSQGPQFAAVTSADDIDTLGTVSIDGRDWSADGTKVVGPGVWGLLSMQKISVGGSSTIGGSGNAPPKAKGASAGSTQANGGSQFPDGYPKDPDAVMKQTKGAMKAAAIATGTYFTTEAAYNAAMPAGGWSGKIVYAEFDPSPSFNIGGGAYNADPSILVIHNDAGTTSIKNTKGFFKGLLIADEVNHTSAPGGWIGAAFLLSPTAASGANAFGTGNTPIRFSSEVLNNLPSIAAPTNPTKPSDLVSIRRIQ